MEFNWKNRIEELKVEYVREIRKNLLPNPEEDWRNPELVRQVTESARIEITLVMEKVSQFIQSIPNETILYIIHIFFISNQMFPYASTKGFIYVITEDNVYKSKSDIYKTQYPQINEVKFQSIINISVRIINDFYINKFMNFVSGYIGSDNHVIYVPPHKQGENLQYDHLNSLLAKYDAFIQLLFREAPIIEDGSFQNLKELSIRNNQLESQLKGAKIIIKQLSKNKEGKKLKSKKNKSKKYRKGF
jgi:hypothetical protein